MSAEGYWNPALAPDMYGVWPYPELKLRCRTYPIQGLNMSGKRYYNPATNPDKSDKRLSCYEGVDRTYLVHEPNMSNNVY
jgi:hypothetical protein